MKISEMSAEERPRERMEKKGAGALSNAELLAVMLRTGTAGMNVIEVARALLRDCAGSLRELQYRSLENLSRIPGIGKSKAMQLAAMMELCRRMVQEEVEEGNNIVTGPDDAVHHLAPLYGSDSQEECWCLFLKKNRKVAGKMLISRGSDSATTLDLKIIIRRALELGAKAVIISHNHPSGEPSPSQADIELTQKLDIALNSMEMSLTDHIIVSGESYYSFAENSIFKKSGKKCKKM